MPGAFNVGPFPLAPPKDNEQPPKDRINKCGFVESKRGPIEGDPGRGDWDLTQLIVKCVATAALVTTAAWLLINYVFDSIFR